MSYAIGITYVSYMIHLYILYKKILSNNDRFKRIRKMNHFQIAKDGT